MKILISGFEPFGKMNINPTEKLLSEAEKFSIGNVEIETILLPVNYDECAEELINKIEEIQPDVVISCGLAAGRTAITPERIGINIKDTGSGDPYPDNRGNIPTDEAIDEQGPDGLFSTLPNRLIEKNLKELHIPASISNSAGTFICNNTLYAVLNHIRKNNLAIKAGFIHFPASTEMSARNPSLPSLPQEVMTQALKVIIDTCASS
ncbi:pyroglutamyl-peptidase I [Mesobacillus sp. AQ2]|jgi:pyroglutamyl-peptidase|uniref:pyroglutamyl-peptidase I n=1 Tax=Bacillaceae TaxID=186817 RepID=UPI0011AA6062|nr:MULTISPECIES: pyroglutamyl-peptidase I [Bacillaceae]MCM3124655.1 pyroglutamyl-peptidase I [Mesobacillus sp. MER 33]MCM3234635.1 pyroglutamyl-peptidase I [Mesobacillus sp. MER 48]WHX41573.1 pyroglutamyl-peptidase I [Mesobacillus sp. AQ2]